MSTFSSANIKDGNLMLKECTHRIKIKYSMYQYSICEVLNEMLVFCRWWFCVWQLITLYPGLMPSNSTFTRTLPPLHDIADITQLCRGDTVKIQQCKKFLLDYLRHITTSRSSSSVDTQPPVYYWHYSVNLKRHLTCALPVWAGIYIISKILNFYQSTGVLMYGPSPPIDNMWAMMFVQR